MVVVSCGGSLSRHCKRFAMETKTKVEICPGETRTRLPDSLYYVHESLRFILLVERGLNCEISSSFEFSQFIYTMEHT